MVEERFVRNIPIQAKLFWPEFISKSNFDAEWSQWFKLGLFVGGGEGRVILNG